MGRFMGILTDTNFGAFIGKEWKEGDIVFRKHMASFHPEKVQVFVFHQETGAFSEEY